MDDIHFSCTGCGRCCHGLKLRLSVAEALAWLANGHPVQILLDAVPWSDADPATTSALPEYERKRLRSFAATSGELPCRIEAILTSAYDGACPNLGADMRCGIYERRPSICRIFPAATRGVGVLASARSMCPPEAWSDDAAALIQGGRLVDSTIHAALEQLNHASIQDVVIKQQLCAALKLDRVAFATEGYVMYSPSHADMLEAFQQIKGQDPCVTPGTNWTYVSDNPKTLNLLELSEANAEMPTLSDGVDWTFKSLRSPTA